MRTFDLFTSSKMQLRYVLCAATLATCVSTAIHAEIIHGRVDRVIDGDTLQVITADDEIRVRIRGIDAPETEQAFGGMSQIILARMIEGRRIDVAAVDRDIYGRYVSALLCDGEDVCLRMIERGAAWPYFHYFNRMPRDVAQRYRHAFELARRDRIGLWQEENPEAPWNWRKRHRSWWTRFVFWLKRVLGLC